MFKITSSTLNSNYEYRDVIAVNGNFSKNAETGEVTYVHGDCYRIVGEQMGERIGEFNGYPSANGELTYDLSQMSRTDSNLVWDAIDAIETEIIPVDSEE